MAEVFGIAAAAISLPGIAGELISGVNKLHMFFIDIKDAQENVASLLHSIDELRQLAAFVETQSQDSLMHASQSGAVLERTLRQCQQSQVKLREIVERLDADFKKSRLARLKIVPKTEIINRLSRVVESCKISMQIAQTALCTELALQSKTDATSAGERLRGLETALSVRGELVSGQLADLRSEVHQLKICCMSDNNRMELFGLRLQRLESAIATMIINTQEPGLNPTRTLAYKRKKTKSLLGVQFFQSTDELEDNVPKSSALRKVPKRSSALFELRLPTWPRFYIEVDRTTPLMYAAETGDLAKCHELLESGQGLPLARFSTGQTAADFALENMHVDLYHYLVARGIKSSASDASKLRKAQVLHYDYLRVCREPVGDTFGNFATWALNRTKRFCSLAGIDIEEAVGFRSLREDEDRYLDMSAAEDLQRVVECFRLVVTYPHWSSSDYVQALLRLPSDLTYSIDRQHALATSLLAEFGPTCPAKALVEVNALPFCGELTILHTASKRLAYAWAHSLDYTIWFELISRALSAGMNIHTTEESLNLGIYTPMKQFFINLYMEQDLAFQLLGNPEVPSLLEPLPLHVQSKLNKGVQFWAAQIDALGLDLVSFGKAESQYWTGTAGSKLPISLTGTTYSYMFEGHLMGFKYGSRPHEWELNFKRHCEDYALDLWTLVERPIAVSDLIERIRDIRRIIEDHRRIQKDHINIMPAHWPEEPLENEVTITFGDLFFSLSILDTLKYDRVVSIAYQASVEEAYERLRCDSFWVETYDCYSCGRPLIAHPTAGPGRHTGGYCQSDHLVPTSSKKTLVSLWDI